jgi:hypothetical protein
MIDCVLFARYSNSWHLSSQSVRFLRLFWVPGKFNESHSEARIRETNQHTGSSYSLCAPWSRCGRNCENWSVVSRFVRTQLSPSQSVLSYVADYDKFSLAVSFTEGPVARNSNLSWWQCRLFRVREGLHDCVRSVGTLTGHCFGHCVHFSVSVYTFISRWTHFFCHFLIRL